jgi:hypothetical protein
MCKRVRHGIIPGIRLRKEHSPCKPAATAGAWPASPPPPPPAPAPTSPPATPKGGDERQGERGVRERQGAATTTNKGAPKTKGRFRLAPRPRSRIPRMRIRLTCLGSDGASCAGMEEETRRKGRTRRRVSAVGESRSHGAKASPAVAGAMGSTQTFIRLVPGGGAMSTMSPKGSLPIFLPSSVAGKRSQSTAA